MISRYGGNQRVDKILTWESSVVKKWRSDRDLVGMNERNGACLWLPASCSLSSYIVLLFESCRRKKQRRARAAVRWKKRRWKRAKPERSRRGGLVLVRVVLGVALPCGGHKGSRRILILVSPNLLTYLTYPRSSRRIHPAPWDNSIPSPLFSNATISAPLICLSLFFFFPSSLHNLPFLSRRFFPFLVVPR